MKKKLMKIPKELDVLVRYPETGDPETYLAIYVEEKEGGVFGLRLIQYREDDLICASDEFLARCKNLGPIKYDTSIPEKD